MAMRDLSAGPALPAYSYQQLLAALGGSRAGGKRTALWLRRAMLAAMLLAALLLRGGMAHGSEAEDDTPTVRVVMRDGTVVVGRIVAQDAETLTVVTPDGLEARVPRSAVASLEAGDGRFQGRDPSYSRLMFAPTGRPLRKGDGYFSDFYVLFPSVSYGVTDHLSVSAGMSFIPGISLDEQLFFVAPRLGKAFSDNFAVSVGALYATAGDRSDEDSGAAGIAFGVATWGSPDRSLTAGLGFGYTRSGGDLDFSGTPVLMLGGNYRLSNRISLVSENWLVLREGFDIGEQPFGLALRFFSERLSADVGVLLVGDLLDEGLPIPWLSFAYHFGPRR
jgi:hypothetical protein